MLHMLLMRCIELVTSDRRNIRSVVVLADDQHSDVDEGNGKKMFGYHSDGCSTSRGHAETFHFVFKVKEKNHSRSMDVPLVSSVVKGHTVASLQCHRAHLPPLLS